MAFWRRGEVVRVHTLHDVVEAAGEGKAQDHQQSIIMIVCMLSCNCRAQAMKEIFCLRILTSVTAYPMYPKIPCFMHPKNSKLR